MTNKANVSRRVLLAPRKKRKRSISEARSMIQTRLHRLVRHMKAAKQDLKEIRDLTTEFPSGTFGADIEKFHAADDSL